MAKAQRISLEDALADFIDDLRAANRTDNTIAFYLDKLRPFFTWLRETHAVATPHAITVPILRAYFIHLKQGHTDGGVDAYWRALSAFLRFLERVEEIDASPLRKLRRPKIDKPLLAPATLEDLRKLTKTCTGPAIHNKRDMAIIHILLDTGVRASELCALLVGDVNLDSGEVAIRKTKSRQARTVFISPVTRRHVRAYLRKRPGVHHDEPLILTVRSPLRRLAYDGLRAVIDDRAERAHIIPPLLHAFRRCFAITCWRNGMDILTIARLMGHGSLTVLMRYIAAETGDLATSHEKHGPTHNF